MRIVPVGSSGEMLGSLWFLKMKRENRPFWGYFYPDVNLLDWTNELKSWWQPQLEAPYMTKYYRDSLICFTSHLIKPKWGRTDNCVVKSISGSSNPSRWFLRRACDYSHVCRMVKFSMEAYFSPYRRNMKQKLGVIWKLNERFPYL
jgi:hypothetical protein